MQNTKEKASENNRGRGGMPEMSRQEMTHTHKDRRTAKRSGNKTHQC